MSGKENFFQGKKVPKNLSRQTEIKKVHFINILIDSRLKLGSHLIFYSGLQIKHNFVKKKIWFAFTSSSKWDDDII